MVMNITKIGKVKLFYLDQGKKKSASGVADDMGSFVKVNLKESKRRTKFDTILIPWNNVIKVIVFND